MRTIWKYPLTWNQLDVFNWRQRDVFNTGIAEFAAPQGFRWLHVGQQHGTITVWAEVDDAAPLVVTRLRVVGTGWQIPDDAGEHIGTTQIGGQVWHVYTQLRPEDYIVGSDQGV